MNLYTDEDSSSHSLVRSLRKSGYDVQTTLEAGMSGSEDCLQLVHSIQTDRIFLSRNRTDFENLNLLVEMCGGHHPGIFVICRNATSKMKDHEIVRAIANLSTSGVEIADRLHILNQWR